MTHKELLAEISTGPGIPPGNPSKIALRMSYLQSQGLCRSIPRRNARHLWEITDRGRECLERGVIITGKRRTVSMNGALYERLKCHCDARGLKVSAMVTDLLTAYLDGMGEPEPTEAVIDSRSGVGGVHVW